MAIKKIPNDSHIQGVNHRGSFLKFTRIEIAGTIKIASKIGQAIMTANIVMPLGFVRVDRLKVIDIM